MVAAAEHTDTQETRTFDTVDPGTPLEVWQQWTPSFPPLDLGRCREMIVVAPHPDDEVLGVGGLMSLAAASGIRVSVVAVTDGGASHPGSPTMSEAQLIDERPREARRALTELGLDVDPIRLGFPDGDVAAHEDELARALTELLSGGQGTWCLTPWRGDRHPDHEATARACLTASRRVGIAVLEYPVWMWHWAWPDHPEVPWGRALGITLDDRTAQAKKAAAHRFTSQIQDLSDDPADRAVLPPHILARLLRSEEVVFA
ncbi:PIG-L family deacetylase [Rhodococcus sp. RS1C4]|uniref:PIG-L deacetylase family protein n=1 Tax=Nocardiaceae TaxID=85025 RepID=UPI0003627EDE|nr:MULTISPECIES: PIG-L deacetylase family protein [Rhodococcus]OZC52234.1 PIG-L family deacetylase [Rhodococcus sp. 06-621-2]OZC54959.1 PIG-L family deacetylase [Rhodococcus sp. RS1C4]OZD09965.1 PIG-L family deacetylase [Rhodococcus sp. 06-156-4C]OZD21870.1 PIG-L family deacetylase [Rhodococcus sp. 06-156-3C]OZD24125.1 PIG-L family deacetylase [Rhodococcus sp. 06-156-4a]